MHFPVSLYKHLICYLKLPQEPVPCAPLGERCVYQWGYMEDKYNPPLWQISLPLAKNLIDPETMVASNPLNMFFPANAAEIYNVYSYCGNYFLKSLDIGSSSCVVNNPNLRPNTLENFPASIYGAEIGMSGLDRV